MTASQNRGEEATRIATVISDLLYDDSRIQANVPTLRLTLLADTESGTEFPNETEIDSLTIGEAGDEEVDAVRLKYSHTDEYIRSLF